MTAPAHGSSGPTTLRPMDGVVRSGLLGVTYALPLFLLEVGMREVGRGALAWLTACVGAVALGGTWGLIAGHVRRPVAVAAILLLPVWLGYAGGLLWAIGRAADLSPAFGTAGVVSVALGLGVSAGLGLRRALPPGFRLRRVLAPGLGLALMLLALPLLQGAVDWVARVAPLLWLAGTLVAVTWPRLQPWGAVAVAVVSTALSLAVPNPYFDQQAVVGLTALGASVIALRHLADRRWPVQERLPRHRAGAWVVVVLAGVATHVLVDRRPEVWRELPRTRGLLSIQVRLAQRVTDWDQDGHGMIMGHADCAPLDALANPGAHEIPGNDRDENCVAGPAPAAGAWLEERERVNPRPPPWRGDIVVVLVDTLRFDVSHDARYPNMRALADRSVRFTRAHASSSFTSMSMWAMLTGQSPDAGAFDSATQYAPARPPGGLASRLQAAGYRTILVGGATAANNALFQPDAFGDGFAVASLADMMAPPREVTRLALEAWREQGGSSPRFMWVHHMHVHRPTDDKPAYQALVTDVDRSLGPLLDGLGEDVLLVFTADHGQEFFEHGSDAHASTLHEEVLHVPLWVSRPGLAPREEPALTATRSLMPTIMAMVAPELGPPGAGPYWCLAGTGCADMPIPLSLKRQGVHLHGLISGHRKIIRDQVRDYTMAFDHANDPGELHPLVPVPPDLEAALVDWEEHTFGAVDPGSYWPAYGAGR